MTLSRKYVFQAMRAGNFTSLGSYPLFMLTLDGGTLHPTCARKNAALVGRAMRPGANDKQWHVSAIDINWEDASLMCDDCNERIESAYAEKDSTE
jgi:hypothetical protein